MTYITSHWGLIKPIGSSAFVMARQICRYRPYISILVSTIVYHRCESLNCFFHYRFILFLGSTQ